ncbi:MAG: PQQ-binding-like beta-propeller repeat protein [Planctomycetes bacterium]|nr:PQQ-binding-like beta-propeller repeat protein [Planctomycetota bacterium]
MADTSTNAADKQNEADKHSPGFFRKWFPLLWIGGLTSICAWYWFSDVDPGVANSIAHGAVILSAIGVSIWCALFSRIGSGLTSGIRWLLALLPVALVGSYYLQILPIETIINGDVGVVGWRWRTDAPDKKLDVPNIDAATTLDWQTTPNDYARFLGEGYWAEIRGVELETDWKSRPPRELWRKKIGAGWSAFAIVGNYAVTQEQRDENELVTCYEVQTGKIVWTHADQVRWDPGGAGAMGYAGPRATPTVDDGKVFTQGATGILNCLDARTGEVIWSHDTLAKHDAGNVMWGKACSPLIVDDMVVVSVGGKDNQSIVAYDVETGGQVWASGTYRSSYASPIVTEIAGVRQVVSVDEGFATARRADDGEPLWEYPWDSDSDTAAASSQPVPVSGDRLFLSKGYGHGSLLLQISSEDGKAWQVEPAWRGGLKPVMKTKMGNVVIRDGYVYGIDEVNLQCIELDTGKKQWKKRRRPKFGHGQIMLIGDTILVLSEVGEVILFEASPEKYRELASMRVFDDSQITWNNPAFSSPYLLVRNAEEVACYELPLVEEPTSVEVAQRK